MITQLQPMVSEDEGASITLRCNARGDPQPVVNWYKDGSLLQSDEQISVTQLPINGSTSDVSKILTITSLSKSQEGVYSCVGSNTLPNGTVTHFSSVSITVKESKIN